MGGREEFGALEDRKCVMLQGRKHKSCGYDSVIEHEAGIRKVPHSIITFNHHVCEGVCNGGRSRDRRREDTRDKTAPFGGEGRKWAAAVWKLPEGRHLLISQVKNLRMGFQSRTEGRS